MEKLFTLAEHAQWKFASPQEQKGVIIGCSHHQEWLLPWWWLHFRMHNVLPITFVDFGDMSQNAKKWCARRGSLTTLEFSLAPVIAPKESVDERHASIWKGLDLNVWEARLAWFKKPFACLQTPYQKTVWIDLDCQVRKNIDNIFAYCDHDLKVALCEESQLAQQFHAQKGLIQYGETEYNTGVIVFQHGAEVIQKWAQIGVKFNASLRGDQEAFTRMVFLNDWQISKLAPKYNLRGGEQKIDDNSAIIHWLGGNKEHIRHEIQELQNKHYIDFSLIE
jgi:hypothetical protein